MHYKSHYLFERKGLFKINPNNKNAIDELDKKIIAYFRDYKSKNLRDKL